MKKKGVFIAGIIGVVIVAIVFFIRKDAYKVHESGLEYRLIIENKDAVEPLTGDVVAIRYRLLNPNGELIEESAMFRTQMKDPSHAGGSVEDALSLMHVGDSGVFLLKADDYFRLTKKMDVPDNVDPESKIAMHIKMADVISIAEFEQERQAMKIFGEREEEQILKDFLTRSNITQEPSISGLYIVEERKGTGRVPQPGKKVTVHYMGYFVDGQVFDSSYERKKPFEFRFGVGEVIQGWDEGISTMRVGGKVKLVIPSYLAYGKEQVGPIPPFATLVFEVELLDVE